MLLCCLPTGVFTGETVTCFLCWRVTELGRERVAVPGLSCLEGGLGVWVSGPDHDLATLPALSNLLLLTALPPLQLFKWTGNLSGRKVRPQFGHGSSWACDDFKAAWLNRSISWDDVPLTAGNKSGFLGGGRR